MIRSAINLLALTLTLSSPLLLDSQISNPPNIHDDQTVKTLVVATDSKSDSVVPIPPITAASISVSVETKQPRSDAGNLQDWVHRVANLNGLNSPGVLPWHLVMNYEEFDRSGGVHLGVYEEFWAGPAKYKRIYKSDSFNQTEYATDKGLFRKGDQRWRTPSELQIRSEVLDPLSYASTLQGYHTRIIERAFRGYKLDCVLIENNVKISNPTQYCFEPGGSVLRYDRGSGWFQTVFNHIISFQNRNLAQDVVVYDGGSQFLKLHLNTVELISHVNDTDFLPPTEATGPIGGRISGVRLEPTNAAGIVQWPDALRNQHFVITVDIVIGKNGHVISAHAISGPSQGYKACESAVRKWQFKPYLVLNAPVEVEEKVLCSNM